MLIVAPRLLLLVSISITLPWSPWNMWRSLRGNLISASSNNVFFFFHFPKLYILICQHVIILLSTSNRTHVGMFGPAGVRFCMIPQKASGVWGEVSVSQIYFFGIQNVSNLWAGPLMK